MLKEETNDISVKKKPTESAEPCKCKFPGLYI